MERMTLASQLEAKEVMEMQVCSLVNETKSTYTASRRPRFWNTCPARWLLRHEFKEQAASPRPRKVPAERAGHLVESHRLSGSPSARGEVQGWRVGEEPAQAALHERTYCPRIDI